MTIALTGSSGIYQRWANIGQDYLRVQTAFGSVLDSDVSTIQGGYAGGLDSVAIDSLFTQENSFRGTYSSWLSYLTTVAQNTIIQQANRDQPLSSLTLSNALQLLITQMRASSSTIQRPTTSLTFTPGSSNKGDGVINGSLINQFGDPLDMVLAETVSFLCTADASTGATQYQEQFTISGQPAVSATAWNYPGGSGASGTLKLTDAAVNGLIKDGGFASWGATNTPTFWTISTGAPTTNIVRSTSPIRGNYALEFLSDGSTLTKINQAVTLAPNVVYAVNFWAKQSSLDASGQFRVRICDGTSTTVNNDAGNGLTLTVNTNGTGTGIGTGWTQVQAFFATPRQLPLTGTFLELGYTTSPANTINTTIDLVGFSAASQLYAGGPFVQGFSKGLTLPNAQKDTVSLAVANGATNASFVRFLDRIFQMRNLGPTFYIPSASSPTIPDSLL